MQQPGPAAAAVARRRPQRDKRLQGSRRSRPDRRGWGEDPGAAGRPRPGGEVDAGSDLRASLIENLRFATPWEPRIIAGHLLVVNSKMQK